MKTKNEKTTKNVANEVKTANTPAMEQVKNRVTETSKEESMKVTAKVAIKSTNAVSQLIRTERIGVNATIRLLLEAVNNGNEDAVNTLCALCDVPLDMAHIITLEHIRNAVNEYFPLYMEDNGRRINVKQKTVYYTIPQETANMDVTEATKVVRVGYILQPVTDYLQALTSAAKARAKGIKQRQAYKDAVYTDAALSTKDKDVKANAIADARNNKVYDPDKVNVWKNSKHIGYCI